MDMLSDTKQSLLAFAPIAEPWLLVVPHRWATDDEVKHMGMATAGATPRAVVYNREFIESMALPFRVYTMLHEISHCALEHLFVTWVDYTTPYKDFLRIRNIAMDAVIDTHLFNTQSVGYKVLGTTDACDPKYKKRWEYLKALDANNKTWQQVYWQIRDSECEGGEGGDMEMDAHEFGGPGDMPLTEAEKSDMIAKVARAREQVEDIKEMLKAQANERGSSGLIAQPPPAKVPWQVELRRWTEPVLSRYNTSWMRPAKSAFAAGLLRQGADYMDQIPTIRIGTDTSGSMYSALQQASGEIKAIINECAQACIRFDYDTGVQFKEVLEEAPDLSTVSFHGLGGTCIRAALEELATDPAMRLTDPNVPTIIITDGYDDYESVPKFLLGPVLYLMVEGCTPPPGATYIMLPK
jgi:predicted metal-dependent peptidase